MEFNVKLENVVFKVVVLMDEYGPDIDKIYAPNSDTDISYFMDSWHGEILNEVLKQMSDAALEAEEESINNLSR